MEEMKREGPDWSTLHEDLIISIANRLPLENYVVFASVCRSWRAVLSKHSFNSSNHHRLPWLILLRQRTRSNSETIRIIYSLSNNKLYKLLPPSPPPPRPRTTPIFSSLGWIMTAAATSNDLALFHPLSPDRSIVTLPNCRISTVHKLLLSSKPTFPPPSDFIAVTIVLQPTNQLLYWRPGNSNWKKILTVPRHSFFLDLALFNGRFYAVDHNRRIYALNLGPNLPDDEYDRVATLISHLNLPKCDAPFVNPYDVEMLFLVESEGSLLVVQGNRQWWGEGRHETMEFRVFEVDVNDGAFRKVENLGDRALFVGDNSSSFSVKASEFEGCKCNCVYFADDFRKLDKCWVRNKDIGIFHLETGEVEHFFVFEETHSNYLAPLWVQPSFFM
ncbi:F-box protein At2g26160-like [Humulus lupulus]|uniref:F-box protein At2g26160-like n=1 Tax=Humulus lupulus TaxID=3486 RepID=UPI002B40CAF9|nr:F-box protein At2g26160-like [Humulus lupulus]